MQAGWSQRRPLSWVVHEETYGRRGAARRGAARPAGRDARAASARWTPRRSARHGSGRSG